MIPGEFADIGQVTGAAAVVASLILVGCKKQHCQFRNCLIEWNAYQGYTATIREQIAAFLGFRAVWRLVRHTCAKDFAEFLDQQVASVPVDERASMFNRRTAQLGIPEESTPMASRSMGRQTDRAGRIDHVPQ